MPPTLNPQVWRVQQNKAFCLLCKDTTGRRLDNAHVHELSRAHEAALQHFLSKQKENVPLPRTSFNITEDPKSYLLDMGTRRLLQSMSRVSSAPSDPGSDVHMAPNSPPTPPPSVPSFDWNLFDANGGIDLNPSAQEQGLSQIAEALLQYMEDDPDNIGSDDDLEDADERSDGEDEGVTPAGVGLNFESLGRERMRTTGPAISRYWYPWPDRITCTLNILMHLPRSVFSHRQLDLFLWLLKENGVDDVPTVKTMQSLNDALQKLCSITSLAFDGALGHKYFMNDLAQLIAQEMANPKVHPHLKFYPEDASNKLSEANQADRWLNELDSDQLTPMIRIGRSDFYIHEPAYLRDKRYCMPVRWFLRDQKLFAKCWDFKPVTTDGQSGWAVVKRENYKISADLFLKNLPEMRRDAALYGIPDPANILYVVDSHTNLWEPWLLTDPCKGNAWRDKAGGSRVMSFPIWLYCDDTSGNVSKKWNKHNSFLFTPAGLPRSEAQKEFNVHFLSTSNIALPLEMLDGIADQLTEAEKNGIWAWDCELQEAVLVFPVVLAMLGDNPMQSEFACHIGLWGKFFCRVCDVKGKDANDGNPDRQTMAVDTNSDGGDDSASEQSAGRSGVKRKGKKIIEDLEQMIKRVGNFIKPGKARTKAATLEQLNTYFCEAKKIGTKTKLKSMRTESGALDEEIAALPENTHSPVWRIKGLDPHRDTPVEILHVVLLGFIKYFWRDLIHNQLKGKDDKKALLETRLSSLDVSGLGISPLAGHTLVTYAGSLTGRDFRAIAQVAPYVIYDLVSEECRNAWISLSKMVPLIWQPQIDNLDSYLDTLTNEVQSFLLTTAKWTNRWFNKPKFHILVHLPEHVRRFGPAMLFATEAFESFNAIIRAKSVHSNRHAPSRDIAHAGGLFLLKDLIEQPASDSVLSSRPFSHKKTDWTSVGPGPAALVASSNTVTGYLGLDELLVNDRRRGTCVRSKRPLQTWSTTQTGSLFPRLESSSDVSVYFYSADLLYLSNGDECKINQFVIVCDPSIPGKTYVGQIKEVVNVEERSHVKEMYGMPSLRSTTDYRLASLRDLLCTVNVQHDCASRKCEAAGESPIFQERENTGKTKPTVVHRDYAGHLMLNTAQMRDARHLQLYRLSPAHFTPEETTRILYDSAKKEDSDSQPASTSFPTGSHTFST
ncbi:hypothetical protein EV421DRAFT_1900873 [Armillaria borealis]|uniref:Uncharacterized protein n=1 Tax=Armillaria borealis TaxID=47425 RepID=A0AA39MWB4_9AGAR|nr:hypothetical protein EV421DRAFT_1900873 [Armillaria borealis]